MATSGKDVMKNANMLKRAMGIKTTLKPGDLTIKAKEIMNVKPRAKKFPASNTKVGLGMRGLI